MNILDENFLAGPRQTLLQWHLPFRQIGDEVGRKGMGDDEIIPFLHSIHQPTFFTLDADFYKGALCHARYCLVSIDARQGEAAIFVRRVLRYPEFDTVAKRMGTVMRVSYAGLSVWRLHAEREVRLGWV